MKLLKILLVTSLVLVIAVPVFGNQHFAVELDLIGSGKGSVAYTLEKPSGIESLNKFVTLTLSTQNIDTTLFETLSTPDISFGFKKPETLVEFIFIQAGNFHPILKIEMTF